MIDERSTGGPRTWRRQMKKSPLARRKKKKNPSALERSRAQWATGWLTNDKRLNGKIPRARFFRRSDVWRVKPISARKRSVARPPSPFSCPNDILTPNIFYLRDFNRISTIIGSDISTRPRPGHQVVRTAGPVDTGMCRYHTPSFLCDNGAKIRTTGLGGADGEYDRLSRPAIGSRHSAKLSVDDPSSVSARRPSTALPFVRSRLNGFVWANKSR